MQNALTGKRMLITQSTEFMGPMLCEVFAQQGATVVASPQDLSPPDAAQRVVREAGAIDVLVVNLALPYQDLAIMDACLATGTHYLDTANYEPKDEAKFEYKWQWAYHDRFREKGLMALLGSGFDPGVTSVFAMWLKKHKLKTIRQLDILDCIGGEGRALQGAGDDQDQAGGQCAFHFVGSSGPMLKTTTVQRGGRRVEWRAGHSKHGDRQIMG